MPKHTAEAEPSQRASQSQAKSPDPREVPALRHVGATLESDPAYFGVLQKGKPTVEAQIVADFRQEQTGSLETDGKRQGNNEQPEPLKTRLPGDTSSDPHTDLGPDNATTLQNR